MGGMIHAENLEIKDGMLHPVGKEAVFRSAIKRFDQKRNAAGLTVKQSDIWQNWNPVPNIGPGCDFDSPVFLSLGPGNYWYFARHNQGAENKAWDGSKGAFVNKGRGGTTDPYYATMVDTLDWMIGKVITYLEETDDPRNPGHKLVDNTYIIVSSDNGGLADSSYLKHAYPFRPGLFALIRLGQEADAALKNKGKTDAALQGELEKARALYAAGKASDKAYCATLKSLRDSIRDLKGTVPQADNYYINLFRQSGAF